MPKRPSTRYGKLVEEGRLDADASQLDVLTRLDALAPELEGYAPPQAAKGLSWLFNRKKQTPRPRNVYIWGDVGRGKTLIMDMFHDAIEPQTKRRVHFHAFMQEIHHDIHQFRKSQDKGLVERSIDPIMSLATNIARQSSVLCLDEFQVKDITDAMILGRLFEALLKAGCVIIVTSNIPPDELYRHGLNRNLFEPSIDLIKKEFAIIMLDSPSDYRLAKLSGEKVYFCPLGPGASARIKLMWRKVTGEETSLNGYLEVQGRQLEVPHEARGACWFSFEDLCEQPLGPADYLAIAKAYNVVFITDIPELGKAQANAARRFINLIDSLYDARTRVVISAETPPEGIYRYADTPVEFARTVSRLTEMQSAKWWDRT